MNFRSVPAPGSDTAKARKARGAFFTPTAITDFLAEWAIRSPDDVVLEPSCGEAVFLLSAANRLRRIGALELLLPQQLHGLDIHDDSVKLAERFLADEGITASLNVCDFFEREPTPSFDVVIGNPPYVRYQSFTGESRARALGAALRQGVRLTQLASSWAAFTVHASAFLKPEGRLGLVLPAELLAVKYAAEIRRFLLSHFKSVRLVLFENLVFPGVLEEVVLLLAEGCGGARSFEVYQARTVDDLANLSPQAWTGFTPREGQKWTPALLPSQAIQLYDEQIADRRFEVLLDWGETYLGVVTGNNDYFTLTREQASKLGLPQSELLRISPPGSRHLRGLTLSEDAWDALAHSGGRCYLFAPSDNPSKAALHYIAEGERQGVHQAYKCRVRVPWWRVPLVDRPDFLFTYMNNDRTRLVRNGAGVHLLNSLYGVKLHQSRKLLGQELLALASLNSMTLLGAEIVGRSYGGGMLKHEPTEADALPMPSFETLEAVAQRLRLLQAQVGAQLRRNDITPAVDIVDRLILKEHLGLTDAAIAALREARATLMQRRLTRGRGQRGKD